MCPGECGKQTNNGPPSMLWFDMTDHKLVAECIGKDKDFGFGTSCTYAPATDTSSAADPEATTGTSSSGKQAHPHLFPRWSFKESYFIAGGPLQRSSTFRPPDGRDPDDVPDAEWPLDATLMLYKVDALARYLAPVEKQSKASKSLLERMLAELNPPKKSLGRHVK